MRLHSERLGRGLPVIILHGLFGSGENWRSFAAKLAADFQVWLVDLRNHGRSEHAPSMDLPSMAEDLAEFVQANNLQGAHLLGHSLGGKVAMQLALAGKGLLRSLVVVDIAPREYEPRHGTILGALRSFDPNDFKERKAIEEFLAPAIPDLAVRRFLLKSLARDERHRFQWQLNLEAITRNYHLLNAAPVGQQVFVEPALFVRGEKSDYLLDTDEPLVRRWFPNARFCCIPRADHWVHATAPNEFFRCVSAFLNHQGASPEF